MLFNLFTLNITTKPRQKKYQRFIGNCWVFRATSFRQLTKNIHKTMKTWTLSIKQKFRLKFRKFHVPNKTVHSSYTDPTQATARLVIVLVSRIQKSGTGDNNFVKWKGTFRSDRPKEMTRPVKVDHLQRCSQIFRSDRTEMVRSIWFLTKNSGILSWMKSAQWYDFKGEI